MNTGSKTTITTRITELKRQFTFPENSFEHKMLVVLNTQERESQLRREVKQMWTELHEKTKVTIEQMPIEQALTLLEEKWLEPILKGIAMLPINMLFAFIGKLKWLGEKYKNTFSAIGEKIESTEKAVATLDKGKHINNNKMDCQPYRKRRPATKKGGVFAWQGKEENVPRGGAEIRFLTRLHLKK